MGHTEQAWQGQRDWPSSSAPPPGFVSCATGLTSCPFGLSACDQARRCAELRLDPADYLDSRHSRPDDDFYPRPYPDARRRRERAPGAGRPRARHRAASGSHASILLVTAAVAVTAGIVAAVALSSAGAPARNRGPARARTGTTPREPKAVPTVAGPGCAPATGASGTARKHPHGDGWVEVGGGPVQCGGHALATFTTRDTRVVHDTYTWRFRTSADARCTLWVFVADTNPSSSVARYDVYGGGRRVGGFSLIQVVHKGEWVEVGTWLARQGDLRLVLTDRANYPGAHHHVTASASGAYCR